MQNTFKVGDKVKVVKFTQAVPSRYYAFINREFLVLWVGKSKQGVTVKDPDCLCDSLFFYNDEIELVKDEPAPQEVVSPSQVSQSQEVVPTPKKSIAWAVVNKATGKVEWIRQTRRVARKLAKFQNETSTHVYQVKKIEYEYPTFPTHYSTYTPLFKDALLNKIAKDVGLVIDPLNRKVTALEIEFFCHALVDHVGKEVLKTIKEETNKL